MPMYRITLRHNNTQRILQDMAQIDGNDTLFATVRQRGIVIARMTIEGVNGLAEVLMRLMGCLNGYSGLATVNLRSSQQGWNRSIPLMLPKK